MCQYALTTNRKAIVCQLLHFLTNISIEYQMIDLDRELILVDIIQSVPGNCLCSRTLNALSFWKSSIGDENMIWGGSILAKKEKVPHVLVTLEVT